jgi:Domain of unknown function (DUF4114)/RTX calcium-binding nonapeptide repeat (4 copies)/Metallo-peptidase family M12B Reprolysin-like
MATDADKSTINDAIAKGGLFGGPFDSAGVDANARALLIDYRWTTSSEGPQAAKTIPYAFPTQTSDYTSVPGGYAAPNLLAGFAEVTAAQKAAVHTTFDLVSSYTGVKFVEVSSGLAADAAIRVAHYGQGGSEAYFPSSDGRTAGDTFLGGNGAVPAQYFGSDGFLTIVHELGHALGLKHGHESTDHGALDPSVNDNEFSVMTYASYLNSPIPPPTAALPGSSPQSWMMYDIAALQAAYGANFSKVGTSALYTWDTATGQESINGRPAPATGTTSTDKIFSTVWTMGAYTTYDLSTFGGNQVDDLRPGHWLTFSQAQLADLNNAVAAGTAEFMAKGNIYNALLYHDDLRSEVSNLITGDGNDTLIGNQVDNFLSAKGGNDIIVAGAGNDVISGGAGLDTVFFGTGHDVLRDSLADMNGDITAGMSFDSSLDVWGVRFGHDSIAIAADGRSATLSTEGASVKLNGDFVGGDFLMAARGIGAAAHTDVSFVQFLPSLSEGVSVAATAVNGIASQPFLTGDGAVRFTLDFKSAVSAFSNELGYYKIGADGTIHDVHILFGNTLNVPAGQQTIDLGTPGANERIGFFLVTDGFDFYGKLPDDLSFTAPGSNAAANLAAGLPPVLHSASLGTLTAAQIFHSFAALNANGADQVLSGLTSGGHQLTIGFEDMPRATGDNDFQDVVIAIHVTPDDNRIA